MSDTTRNIDKELLILTEYDDDGNITRQEPLIVHIIEDEEDLDDLLNGIETFTEQGTSQYGVN